MNIDILNNITNSIKDTLGEENSALISDNLALLITENNKIITEKQALNSKIETLEKNNDNLVKANSRLLQQIPMGFDDKNEDKKEDTKSPSVFTLNDVFDEKGNFKRKMK